MTLVETDPYSRNVIGWAIKARGVVNLVECGPGKVLAGLTGRIDADLTGLSLLDPASLDSVETALSAG